MNYVDIACIALVALNLLFGLIGKAYKKFWSLLFVIASVVIAFFTCGTVAETANTVEINGQTVEAFLASAIEQSGMNIPTESISSLISGLVKFLTFWAESIGLMIVLNLVGGLIITIIHAIRMSLKRDANGNKIRRKRNTAHKTLGIFSAVKMAIILVVFLLPVMIFSPIISSIGNVIGGNNETLDSALATVEEQLNGSKVLSFGTDFLTKNQEKITFLKYGEEDKSLLINDIKSLGGLLKMASIFMPTEGGEDVNPLASIAKMDPEEITELFESLDDENSPVRAVINDVVAEMDLGIDLSTVKLADEAETIILIMDMVQIDEETGDISGIELSEEKIPDLVDAFANSQLVLIVAENAEGALSDLDEDTVNDIQTQLESKVDNGLSQEDYETIMKLFAKN